MDFTTRGDAPAASANRPASAPSSNKKGKNKLSSKVLRYASVVLLFSVAVLLMAVAASFAFNKNNGQVKYVDKNQLQAVFLNGGQVYFGKIGVINDNYIAMNNIYYLRVNQQVQPNQQAAQNSNDVSLVKLGCELHGPQDEMVINTDQVVFWENLKSDGQVAKAVEEYVKQNPNGQDCSKVDAAAQTQTPAATTPAATNKKQ